jgi:hypothetical protein
MNRDSGVVDGRHDCREARTSGVVAIFIPPSVFGEVKTVFDSPVVSDVTENVVGRNLVWIQARDEVASVMEYNLAVASGQLTIDPHYDLAIGQVKCLANMIGVF